jgi:hypothetical protein
MAIGIARPTVGWQQVLIALASNQVLIFRRNICDRIWCRGPKRGRGTAISTNMKINVFYVPSHIVRAVPCQLNGSCLGQRPVKFLFVGPIFEFFTSIDRKSIQDGL